jgi:hypothetical protein
MIYSPMDIAERPNLTILVNSSDGFEDCWAPFFKLLYTQWPDCSYPVLLNTEEKNWSFPKANQRASRVGAGEHRRLSWSECLIRAIDQIETPLLLYFQEDYFLDTPVRVDVIENAIRLMLRQPDIGHIALTKQGSFGPFEAYPMSGFSKIRQDAQYRISTQAGLWRPDVLRSYLDPKENGWMFEIFGTWRAQKRRDLFLVADFSPENGGPAIDYVHTGIIKGKWHPSMPALFAQLKIDVDFTKRGFYNPPPTLVRKWEVVKKLAQDPLHAARQLF